jgi:tripartite-type tricarboxylate transporter receptor subunit TctC
MTTSRAHWLPRLLVLAGLASATFVPTASAQTAEAVYPSKPVRIVVPYPPGGPNDVIARVVAQRLTESLRQPFIIDNRPGATGMTGTNAVAKSPADGYTLLVSASVHVIYPAIFRQLPFDPIKDFAPITQIARAPLVLSVTPGLPVKSVQELIALAKAQPGKLQYASSGNGSATHLAAELFKTQAGIEMQHIPYKGSAPAMSDVMAGHAHLVFDSLGSTTPFMKTGKLRSLAVSSASRAPAAPDLPSIAESGLPGYDVSSWHGLWAPAGTPKAIVDKLAAEVQKALQMPETRERLSALGIEPVGSSPTDFHAYNASEMTKWAQVVKASGAKLD